MILEPLFSRLVRIINATGTNGRNDNDVSSVGHSLAGHTITMDASLLRGVMAGSSARADQPPQNAPPSNGSRSVASTNSKKVRVRYDADGNISHIGDS